MIEVILLERIERLGVMGQTVKVRPGFARNYLLPQKKALRATKANLELFEKQRAELEARNAAERAKAEAVASKIDGLKLVVVRQASEMGQLFGSVSARDVSEVAIEAGHQIGRGQIQIDMPIKTLGLFAVRVRLHPEVTTTITINVARSPEEAAVQAEKAEKAEKAAKKEKASTIEAPSAEAPAEAAAEAAAPADGKEKPKKAKKTAAKADKASADDEKSDAPAPKKAAKKTKKADAE